MAPQDRNHRSAAQTLQVLKICPSGISQESVLPHPISQDILTLKLMSLSLHFLHDSLNAAS